MAERINTLEYKWRQKLASVLQRYPRLLFHKDVREAYGDKDVIAPVSVLMRLRQPLRSSSCFDKDELAIATDADNVLRRIRPEFLEWRAA